jgi:1,4-alpha-glucan branching enzyme
MSSEQDKLIIYEKGDLLFIFNWHQSNSYENYSVGTKWQSDHFIVFDSDEARFGGHKRLEGAHNIWFKTHKEKCLGRDYKLNLYIPTRTVIVLCAYESAVNVEGLIESMPAVTD